MPEASPTPRNNPLTVRDGEPSGKTIELQSTPNEAGVTQSDSQRPSLNLSLHGDISIHDLTSLPTELAPKSAAAVLVVPGYDIIEELGRGGMGVVYKARQIHLNRVVALKMVLNGAVTGEADLARMRVEAQAVAALRHPNVVQIYDVGEADGLPFLALEFCDSGSLGEQIRGNPLTNNDAAALMESLARGVHAAHRNRIVHRDLKPGNVLLNTPHESEAASDTSGVEAGCSIRGKVVVPKISDFGLAKQLDSAQEVTRTGAILGTPSYMAPEQASGQSRSVGPATDVYSLGVILYECLTGRVPFQAETTYETIVQVQEQPPLRPSAIAHHVDSALEAICLKCLAKRPEDRYSTALELAEDLAAYRRGDRVKALVHAQSQLFRDFLRESRHTEIMARWGRVWYWHAAIIAAVFVMTDVFAALRITSELAYVLLWGSALALVSATGWAYRFRRGPMLTPIEQQIGKLSALSTAGLFGTGVICHFVGLAPEKFVPFAILQVGIYVGCMAVLLGGSFYPLAALCGVSALALAMMPGLGTSFFGLLFAAGLVWPAWKYSHLADRKPDEPSNPQSTIDHS